LIIARGKFLHISENDSEYLPGWDNELLSKFAAFPELGQLSIYSPFPQPEINEIRDKWPTLQEITRAGRTIHPTELNVYTPSMIRRELWDKGLRWRTRAVINNTWVRFPADYPFSQDIIKMGYWVAWNDKHTAINWGNDIREVINDPEYYIANAKAKPRKGIEGLRNQLRQHGYDLIEQDGKYQIIKST
jgi:hypothetical protein